MTGLGHKIKEALTPGHKHRNAADVANGAPAYPGTESAMGYNAPLTTNNPATGGIAGRDLVGNNSMSSSSSSDDEGVAGVRTTTATATAAVPAAGTGVCETRTFTEVEDRPVMRERVERIIEHRPVEKQFVVETRPVGEREVAEGVHYESAGVREYEVDRADGTKCPTTTGAGAGGHTNVL